MAGLRYYIRQAWRTLVRALPPVWPKLRLGLCVLGIGLTLATPQLNAGGAGSDKIVAKRISLMATQKAALETLSKMNSNRMLFSPEQAAATRKLLIKTTRAIPEYFRVARSSPNSHARDLVWSQWSDFKARAKQAQRAARQLDGRTPEALATSLPALVQSCLSCHAVYRDRPNVFVTH